MNLSDNITTLKGIGEKKAQIFNQYGITTLEDLIQWFPRRYEDRRSESRIDEIEPGKDYLVCGKVISRRYRGNPYKKNSPLSLLVQGEGGMVEIVFFNGKYIANFLGEPYLLSVITGRFADSRDKVFSIFSIHPLYIFINASDFLMILDERVSFFL